MGLLKEMFGGQHRVTPDRELVPRYTGKTLFTNREPVPLLHRVAMVLFSFVWIAILSPFLWIVSRGLYSLAATVWFVLLLVMIAFWAVAGLLAMLGLPPFQSKRRQ